MAEIVPNGNNDSITYFENHLTPWGTNQAAIGISLTQVGDIVLSTQAARNAFDAAVVARDQAKASTAAMNTAIATMRADGAAIIKTIRAFAEATNDPNVFFLSLTPAPSPGNPLPPAPTPTNFIGLLNSDGHVDLEWKSNLEGRIFFAIERQVTPVGGVPGPWENRGAVPAKKFTDTTVPPGANSVNYRVAARRGTSQSIFTDPVIVLLATPGTAVA